MQNGHAEPKKPSRGEMPQHGRRHHHHHDNREAGEQLEPFPDEEEQTDSQDDRYFLISAEEPEEIFYRISRHFASLGLLVISSMWGLLTREGLVALNTYDGQSIAPTIWAQAIGCLVMGWTVGNRAALEQWYPPAYIMLSTGYCGSVTTFSSWMLEVFQAYGNELHYNRHGLHNVMDAFTQTGATLGISIVSLYAGRALAKLFPVKPVLHHFQRYTTHRRVSKITAQTRAPYTVVPDVASIILGCAFWAGAAVFCAMYVPFRRVTFAVVLSPPGAILRWYLSRLNSAEQSKQFPYWPLGTLAANLIATAVISAAFVGQHIGREFGNAALGAHTPNACYALHALQEGFCGCLSTVSTFVVELDMIKPKRRAFGYAFASYFFGMVLCVLIIGSPWWSIGMQGSCTV